MELREYCSRCRDSRLVGRGKKQREGGSNMQIVEGRLYRHRFSMDTVSPWRLISNEVIYGR